MNRLGVDIIVPCYNYGRYLRQCTQSVLQETGLSVRVLIIDDASTDGSADEAHRLAAEDWRVQVITHLQNKGHIATFNEGIAWVDQPYMLLLSADDMVAPGALARAVKLMEERPQVSFVFGRAVQFRSDEELARAGGGEQGVTVSAGWDFVGRVCRSSINPVETATAVVRTAVQKRVGGYRAELPHAGDLEMWLRCAAHGDVGEIAEIQGFVRMHDDNMRHAYSGADFLRDYRQRRDAFERFFSKTARFPDNHHLRAEALTSLAQNLLWDASRAVERRQGCAEMIALAEELWPDIRRTRQYRRLMIKRLLHPLVEVRRPMRSRPEMA